MIKQILVDRVDMAVYYLILLLSVGIVAMFVIEPLGVIFKYAEDDMFYYHILADNALSGNGIVFNQGVPTNGFHPLYFIYVLIIRWVAAGIPIDPLLLNLLGNIILHILTGVIIYNIGIEMTNRKVSLAMFGIWTLNPAVFGQVLSGMEPILQVFFISVLSYYYITNDLKSPTLRQGIILGVLIALVFLSRMDGVFIGIGIGFALLIRRSRDSNLTGSDLIHQNHIVGAMVSVFFSLPWLLYGFINTGYIFPISGKAIRLVELTKEGKFGLPNYLFSPIDSIKNIIGFVFHYLTLGLTPLHIDVRGSLGLGFGTADRIIVFGTISIILMIFIMYLIYTLYREDQLTHLSRIDFLLYFSLLTISYYTFYQYRYRDYYILSLYFVITLLIGIVLYTFSEKSVWGIRNYSISRFVIFLVIITFIISQPLTILSIANTESEPGFYQAAEYVETELAEDARVGNFNTGYIQYYTPNHDVINLDGVINTHAYRAMEDGRLDCYIINEGIDYIVGLNSSFSQNLYENNRYSTGAVELREIETNKEIIEADYIHVYEVIIIDQEACQ